MALTKAHNRMIQGAVVNVLDYGAVGDGTTDDTSALQAAINAAQAAQARLFITPGVFLVTSTLTIANARAMIIEGSGFGHVNTNTGTIIKWGGASGGTIMHLDGFSQGRLASLAFDGNSKAAGIGLLLDQGSSVVSQKNTFDQVRFQACEVGTSIGVFDADQGNNDQCAWMNCWWEGNSVAFDLNGDQHVQHNFFNPQFIDCNNGTNTGAAIRTGGGSSVVGSGSGAPNGGGFNIYGGAFLDNDIDMDIPRESGAISVIGSRSENARVVMNHSSASGTVGRTISFVSFFQNSAHPSATYSIDFDTANNLTITGGRFVQPILIDNQVAGTRPTRSFTGVDATITRGSTQPYNYFVDGRYFNLNDKLVVEDDNIRYSPSDEFSVTGSGGTRTIGVASDYTGLVLVRRQASDRAALFFCQNGAVSDISVDAVAWSSTGGNASTSNLYVTGGNLTLENNTASTQVYRIAILGGAG